MVPSSAGCARSHLHCQQMHAYIIKNCPPGIFLFCFVFLHTLEEFQGKGIMGNFLNGALHHNHDGAVAFIMTLRIMTMWGGDEVSLKDLRGQGAL